ncbi:predicted protein [Botrytis cinerea T4]|uniref:Uncharacterized protein n=1 Tax=Botryotinia fuckeliana (strain T4) TaxID=999810 RepID=G2XYN9_BOTF4|nr:predicted protein [Botrytis cinerea T4]
MDEVAFFLGQQECMWATEHNMPSTLHLQVNLHDRAR